MRCQQCCAGNTDYYGEENRVYNRNRIQYSIGIRLFKRITYPPCPVILDLGCGLGEFSDILSASFKDLKVICVDGVAHFVNLLKEKGYESYKVDLETESLPFLENSFDIVIALDVIEHLWNTDFFLKNVRRILKSNGHFIITTTNYNWIRFRIVHLLGKSEHYTYKSRHKKFYTVRSIISELEKHFRIKTIDGTLMLSKNKFFVSHNINIINLLSPIVGVLCTKQ